MIFGNINDPNSFVDIPAYITQVLVYAKNHDLLALEGGEHIIDGDQLFFNRISYTTTTVDNRFWESHKKYLDVHVILQGHEKVDVNLISNMKVDGYETATDYVSSHGHKKLSCDLSAGDFLVLYPQDVHMTCLMVDDTPSDVEKVVFKVLI